MDLVVAACKGHKRVTHTADIENLPNAYTEIPFPYSTSRAKFG